MPAGKRVLERKAMVERSSYLPSSSLILLNPLTRGKKRLLRTENNDQLSDCLIEFI